MTEWQSIDTAPKDGTKILGYCGYVIEMWQSDRDWETQ